MSSSQFSDGKTIMFVKNIVKTQQFKLSLKKIMFFDVFERKNRDSFEFLKLKILVKLTDGKHIDLAKKKLVKLMRDPFASNLQNELYLESCEDKKRKCSDFSMSLFSTDKYS